MKTKIATLMIVFGLFLSATTFANEPVPASKAVSNSVSKLIQSELEYPEFAIDEKLECIVVVSIVIEDDGTFDVTSANCVSSAMKEYVIEEIEDLVSKEHAQYAGQTVLLKVKFDLLLI